MLPVKIKLINMGKIEREYLAVIREYEKRISFLAHAKFIRKGKVDNEAILLDPQGREIGSDEFYQLIKNYAASGKTLIFAVGPPQGFEENIKRKKESISLSKLTLRHELAYLILLEQIYRALLRMRGTSYEK